MNCCARNGQLDWKKCGSWEDGIGLPQVADKGSWSSAPAPWWARRGRRRARAAPRRRASARSGRDRAARRPGARNPPAVRRRMRSEKRDGRPEGTAGGQAARAGGAAPEARSWLHTRAGSRRALSLSLSLSLHKSCQHGFLPNLDRFVSTPFDRPLSMSGCECLYPGSSSWDCRITLR